ncbi:acylphosphatase [Clostridium carboxidivorans P7]|uniref:Acylphosphatase n=1 Tax=Clostridium carboxidivorans P7 TaxID=536227 RepID=C6Q1N0_9CLOT|nr:acylphosphatase [Clostridium carboxidivorans]AKN30752.1 acylphosphatase [Clostridium carboxidivorans P7]EET84599.1 acylphosphatase [Clostridium carboxidivorans P7]EFG88544.1 acylphosphatase [Clostridium carboxidivorans P7]
MVRYFIEVFGRVQGVGFRYFVEYTAKTFGVTGWVKNCEGGSVQMEVQGMNDSVILFIDKVKKGNRFAKVEDITCMEVEPINREKTFRVIY